MQGPTLGLGRVMEFTPTTASAVDDSFGARCLAAGVRPGHGNTGGAMDARTIASVAKAERQGSAGRATEPSMPVPARSAAA
jgi:hypothetical protein